MLKAILTELGETKLARSQSDLVAQMNRVLLERINRGRDIVLIIDEAQNLSFEVLEQIRLLSIWRPTNKSSCKSSSWDNPSSRRSWPAKNSANFGNGSSSTTS